MTGNSVSTITDDPLIHNLQQLLTEQTRQSAEKLTLEQIMEAALLEELSIDDCAVLLRETAASEREIVAYVVSSRPFLPERLHLHLQNLLPNSLLPITYVPVSTLPLTTTGQVDKQALTRLEVIDSDLVQRWEERLHSLPEVEQIAVVVQEYTESTPPLHLSNLLTDWKASQTITAKQQVAVPIQSVVMQEKLELKALAISDGGPLDSEPDTPTTLPEALKRAALQQPGNGIVYLQPNSSELFQSYASLLKETERVLCGLRKLGLKPQDKVIFQLELTQDIILAFWGCMLGGFVPVIMAVPPTFQESNSAVDKLCHVWKLLDKPLILTSNALGKSVQSLSQWLPLTDSQVVTIEEIGANQPDTCHHHSQPDDVAFLTLTSGSTGMPKCIMLTHHNLISRARGAIQLCQQSSQDIALNWLPFDHIGSISDWHLRCVYLGCKVVYVSKEYILGRCLNWLDLIDKYRVSHGWAPNFAYSLINDALKQEPEHQWDLSCVKSLITAGESVSIKVVEDCLKNLAIYGFKETAIQPGFGMAEFGSGITYFPTMSEGYQKSHNIDRLSLDKAIIHVGPEHSNSITFTSLGSVIPGVTIRIVNRENVLLPEEVVGRLQVKGEAVFPGYYKAPEVNKKVFSEDGWFDTGDLGFLSKGHLVITGRAKETIIINGTNYYNGEIEAVVEEVEGIETSYTAACAVRDSGSEPEKLAIFFSSPVHDDYLPKLIGKIQEQVVRKIGVKPAYFIPVEREAIPKTPIGKIQRLQLSQRFEAGEFDPVLKRLDILSRNANTLPDWFYQKIWHPKQLVSLTTQPLTGRSLVFLDQLGLGAFLCSELKKLNLPYVSVEVGSDFNQLGDNRYCIDPKNPHHYRQLIAALSENGIPITRVLHLWTYDEYKGEIASLEALEQSQELGVYSLLFLLQTLNQSQNLEHPICLSVIASHTQPTSAAEKISYEKAPILGLVKTCSQEIPWLNCCHIDLPIEQVEINAARILQELQVVQGKPEVAYRDGQRLVACLEKVDLHQEQKQELPFKAGGMYLLSGGLGGIGIELAQYLLKHYEAKLLLVGRTALPERSQWLSHLKRVDSISQRIQAYLSLEQLGGKIIYEAVDICDHAQLQEVVDRAKSHWQCQLDGVIHLAGTSQEQMLVEETKDSLAATLRPKVLGTWVLSQLLKDQPDGVFISFSSVSSFFGGTMVGAYAAANSFLDSFSHYQKYQRSLRSYCFAWSMWDEVGMSRGYQMKELSRARGYYAITAKQGLQSMLAGLHHELAHILIGLDGSKYSIRQYRLKEPYQLQKLCAYFTTSTDSVPTIMLQDLDVSDRFQTRSNCDFLKIQEMPLTDAGEIDREQLVATGRQSTTERVAPRNELERQIATIWQQVLGVPQVGIHDNFFELGGSSLLAMRLFAQIEGILGKNLPLATLFQASTVEQLANLLQEGQSGGESSLVALQPSGSKRPFFCVAGAGGTVLEFVHLVRCLGSEQPFYGLQPLELGGSQTPYTKISSMAAHYIDEMRTVQKSGPYLLGGFCAGGVVAFEMAQQLQAQGEKVALLVLLHTLYPVPINFLSSCIRSFIYHPLSLYGRILNRWRNFWKSRSAEQFTGVLKNTTTQRSRDIYKEQRSVLLRALRSYLPQAYSSQIALFLATEEPKIPFYDPRNWGENPLRWGELATGGLEVYEVPAEHMTMMEEPLIPILAEQLRACLDSAQVDD